MGYVTSARFWLALTAIAVGALPAHAQLPVDLPGGLPTVQLPVDLDRTVGGITRAVNVNELADLRQLRLRELIRTNRRMLEADPAGQPILRAEVLAFSPTPAALEQARAAGFTVVREQELAGLGERIVVLRAPDRWSTRRALRQLRRQDPSGQYDYNHLYTESGAVLAGAAQAANPAPVLSAAPAQSSGVRIGLIDTGVDATHPVFRNTVVHGYGCGDKPVPSAHGTAVASLIAGQSAKFHGAAPGAELFAADVYCGLQTGGAVDSIADAVAWMVRERVSVINVSLVGPRNVMLENVVRVALARGHLIVAAVGNDGPNARPLYPAAYDGVVGVTAVDARERVIVEALRGKQVDFAAPGADMAAATLAHTFAPVRGTSFASPLVAGLLAIQGRASPEAIAALVREAVDLGSRGPDKTYGNGLVGKNLRPEPALASLNEE